jgi:hypothetical protein
MVLHEMQQGGAVSLKAQEGSMASRSINKLISFQGRHADNWTRSASFEYEAAKRGFKTEAQIKDLLTSPKKRALLDEISQEANNMAVNFATSAGEKASLGRGVFVYPWMKGATRYVGHLPANYPVRTGAMFQLGTHGYKETKKRIGVSPSYLERLGLVPFGKPKEKDGSMFVRIVNPISVTPTGTGASVLTTAFDLLSGKSAKESESPLQFANPWIKAVGETVFGTNSVTGAEYKGSRLAILPKSLLGSTASPALPMANIFRVAAQPGPIWPGGPKSPGLIAAPPEKKSPNWEPESGPWAAIVKAVMGPTRPRMLNLTNVNEKGQDEIWKSLPRTERAKAKSSAEIKALQKIAQKENSRLKPEVLANLQARAYLRQRIAEERKNASADDVADNGSLGSRAVYRLEAKILLENGKLDRKTYDEAVAWSQTASDKDVTTGKQRVEDRYFGRASTAKLRKQFRKQGYDFPTINLQ